MTSASLRYNDYDAQNFGRASLYKGFCLNCVSDDS